MKTIILVAGIDYEFKGVDFRVLCNRRMEKLLRKNTKNEDMVFKIFDFRKGEVVTHESFYSGGLRTVKSTSLSPPPFSQITKKTNYEKALGSDGEPHYTFKDGQRGTMSILDVYKAVQKVGVDAPNTLFELSFFSHAWMGGPILVNSNDDGRFSTGNIQLRLLSSNARDPDDMDPRVKDFSAPTMDARALANFQTAFHSDGYVWIWGCAFVEELNRILCKIENHPSYRASGLGNNTVFEFTNLNAGQVELLEKWLGSELDGPFPDKGKVKISFKFLKHFFCKFTTASYSHHIAKAAKVKTFGAVMGTDAGYDTGAGLPLMSVSRTRWARHINFYKEYLGFSFDPEGRFYGEYSPEFNCTAPSL